MTSAQSQYVLWLAVIVIAYQQVTIMGARERAQEAVEVAKRAVDLTDIAIDGWQAALALQCLAPARKEAPIVGASL